jgi:hypothetical protein
VTTLSYIPTIDAYNIDGHRLNYLSVLQITQMYPSVLVSLLDCSLTVAQEIQKTLDKEQERPLFIHISDNSVCYIYE